MIVLYLLFIIFIKLIVAFIVYDKLGLFTSTTTHIYYNKNPQPTVRRSSITTGFRSVGLVEDEMS